MPVIKFTKENEEKCTCPTCELVHAAMNCAMSAESHEELLSILHTFAEDAKDLGVKEYLTLEIESKVKLFNHLEHGHCDEECSCEGCEE
ncbi:hypothetical protein COE51_16450 [Bacillus pseudomycoides]|nr:hypothetical protein COE51_16450 [Bacillus pseudomycoides]